MYSAARAPSEASSRIAGRGLDKYAPILPVVTRQGDVVQYSSRTGTFLELADEVVTRNSFFMARQGLQPPLCVVLKEASSARRVVTKRPVLAQTAGKMGGGLIWWWSRRPTRDRMISIWYCSSSGSSKGTLTTTPQAPGLTGTAE